jgi:hypothetical protein
MKILVYFFNQPTIEILVDDTETGRLFFNLNKEIAGIQPPIFVDTLKYTHDYMIELAQQARVAFNWDWIADHYDISVTAQLHKDLENYVGMLGFDQIPEEHDKLLYNLHHCLHAIQFGKHTNSRFDNLQIEWLTDKSVPLPESFEFVESTRYGDLILINPYVGHNPLQIYRENDFTSLSTTCKFHDVIKPGIVLTNREHVSKNTILNKFKQHDLEFVELHGEDKICYYAGAAVVGHVTDEAILRQVRSTAEELKLDKVEFYE